MAIGYLSLVNQRLACARVLLRQLSTRGAARNASERLELRALSDAICFHLVCGYEHYLRELAQHYGVKQPAAIGTEAQLSSALAALGKTPAELHELQLLAAQPDAWLSQLQAQYRACWRLPTPPAEAEQGLIQVVDLDQLPNPVAPAGSDQLEGWLQAFVELIARQRETSAEY